MIQQWQSLVQVVEAENPSNKNTSSITSCHIFSLHRVPDEACDRRNNTLTKEVTYWYARSSKDNPLYN